jgi:hypothetical protein
VASTADLAAVTGIDYDAKGQRQTIDYGNGVRTGYSYEREIFRLLGIETRRLPGSAAPGPAVHHTRGNITEVFDGAQHAMEYANQPVEPRWRYAYDAIYRLIKSRREHSGQNAALITTTF